MEDFIKSRHYTSSTQLNREKKELLVSKSLDRLFKVDQEYEQAENLLRCLRDSVHKKPVTAMNFSATKGDLKIS